MPTACPADSFQDRGLVVVDSAPMPIACPADSFQDRCLVVVGSAPMPTACPADSVQRVLVDATKLKTLYC